MVLSRFKTVGFLFLLTILSWLFIHVIALFGFFLAVAYPLWWLISSRHTICLLCRAKKEGERCPFCRKIITKKEGNNPKTFSSALLNGMVIFFFSLLSVGIVFVEMRVLHAAGFPPTPKTASFSIPSSGQYHLGEIFPIKLEVVGIKTPINAVQSDISFNPDELEVVDISTADSFANIFIQKEINNNIGYARLSGGLPNPGFSGDRGVFGTIFLRGKVPGPTQVKFLPTTMVLANDGKGSNVLKELATISYLILPEKVTDTKKEEEKIPSHVLGTSTSSATQMIFYDEKQILGANTVPESPENHSVTLINDVLGLIGQIDAFILTSWQKIL